MSSLHIAAEKGEVAERILLPGDPLRAKYIAENFLDGAKEYTSIRNILGYTGTYHGVPVSVQGTGMGMPPKMLRIMPESVVAPCAMNTSRSLTFSCIPPHVPTRMSFCTP